MFDPSSRLFPKKKTLTEKLPFVIRVNFGEILAESVSQISEAIVCSKCGGFMAGTDTIHTDAKIGLVYECPFCGTINPLSIENPAGYESMELVKEKEIEEVDDQSKEMEPTGRPWIACIDTSGSMAGSPLASVKESLLTTLSSLAAAERNIKFGLVEFGDTVRVHQFREGGVTEISPDIYNDFNGLLDMTQQNMSDSWLVDVDEDPELCRKGVKALRASGGTPLGPAMAVSLGMATSCKADRVVLLTDGQANVGIGSLNAPTPSGPTLYDKMAKMYRKTGTTVNMVGVLSGSHINLKTLGVMSELTRGSMYYVEQNDLRESIGRIAQGRRIASDVVIRMIGSKSAKLQDASGISHAEVEELKTKNQTAIGAVGRNDEIYLSIEPEDVVDDEIPLQLQVSYIDQDGKRRSRILTQRLPVTDELNDIANSMDPTLPGTFAVQKSAMKDIAIGNEMIGNIANSIQQLGKHADDPSLFERCAQKLRRFVEHARHQRRSFDTEVMCYCSPPSLNYVQRDYDYVDIRKRATITRADIFGA